MKAPPRVGRNATVATRTFDLTAKTDAEIRQWIINHENANATERQLYKDLLEERARRSEGAGRLEIQKSLTALTQAAREQRYLTYGDLASASNVPWTKARHQMNGPKGHLDRLLEVCHARGMPLLPALCVNESGRQTGKLESDALTGFCVGARRLGKHVSDEESFHRQSVEACFDWARATRG